MYLPVKLNCCIIYNSLLSIRGSLDIIRFIQYICFDKGYQFYFFCLSADLYFTFIANAFAYLISSYLHIFACYFINYNLKLQYICVFSYYFYQMYLATILIVLHVPYLYLFFPEVLQFLCFSLFFTYLPGVLCNKISSMDLNHIYCFLWNSFTYYYLFIVLKVSSPTLFWFWFPLTTPPFPYVFFNIIYFYDYSPKFIIFFIFSLSVVVMHSHHSCIYKFSR